jgi:hypothetical protein
MKSNLFLLCFTAMVAGLPYARGQSIGPSVLNAMGGSGTAGGNTFEWSVGETMVSTYTSSSVIVTEGVLQPKLESVGIADNTLPSLLHVFPNPSSSIVNIHFSAPGQGTLTCRLIDVAGRVLTESNTEVKQGQLVRQLDIRQYACATYMLHVLFKAPDKTETSTTYKIQKLN